jgi:hypothetical protein
LPALFGDHRFDRLAGAFRGMAAASLHLDQGRYERGAGLGAEIARFALDLDDDRRQLGYRFDWASPTPSSTDASNGRESGPAARRIWGGGL